MARSAARGDAQEPKRQLNRMINLSYVALGPGWHTLTLEGHTKSGEARRSVRVYAEDHGRPPTLDDVRPADRYTIHRDDTLQSISKRFYGTPSRWRMIYNADTRAIEGAAVVHHHRSSRGGPSNNPGWYVYAGTVLTIPYA